MAHALRRLAAGWILFDGCATPSNGGFPQVTKGIERSTTTLVCTRCDGNDHIDGAPVALVLGQHSAPPLASRG